MSAFKSGRRPHSPAFPALGVIAIAGLALLLPACASNRTAEHQPPARVAGPPPSTIQLPNGAVVARVEIEDDGLPSQLAPRYRRPEPDDPREPWSPNYGSAGRARSGAATIVPTTPGVPAPIPPSFRASSIDEDEIIRRAIAAHEMRRRD